MDHRNEESLGSHPVGAELRVAALLFVLVLAGYVAHCLRVYEPYTFTHFDPGWQVSATQSLVEDGDLDLRNQLEQDPRWALDQTSRGARGEWYPLHEPLMSMLAVPFYLALGVNGCLVFNMLAAVMLVVVTLRIAVRFVALPAAFSACAITAFATPVLHYAYSFSLDVFGALLLVAALAALVERRFLLGGALWGLAVLGRLANAFSLPGILWLLAAESLRHRSSSERLRPLAAFGLGGLPFAVMFLAANAVMFGSPLETSYDHWQRFDGAALVPVGDVARFSRPLVDGLAAVLFDRQSGLFVGAPLLIVGLALGLAPLWRRARGETIFLLLVAAGMIVAHSLYDSFPGQIGNRYLLAIAMLGAIPLGVVFEDVSGRPERPSPEL